jgi:hypothetical protein
VIGRALLGDFEFASQIHFRRAVLSVNPKRLGIDAPLRRKTLIFDGTNRSIHKWRKALNYALSFIGPALHNAETKLVFR